MEEAREREEKESMGAWKPFSSDLPFGHVLGCEYL